MYSGTHPFLIWSRKLVKSTRERWESDPRRESKTPCGRPRRRTKGQPLVHWSTSDKPTARKRENKGRQGVLSSSDAAPREVLGKASYLDPSSVIPRDPRGKSEEGLSIVNKTRCHQKWRNGKARPQHPGPVLTPHRETLGGRCRTSTSLPRLQGEPRIYNGNEGQVLYGIPLSNEQVFVGQWPKGQIKNARLITTTPPENTSPRDTRGKVPHLSFRP